MSGDLAPPPAVDLYWIPLGAGSHVVRFNGMLYEAVAAIRSRRPRFELFHSALTIALPGGRYTVEMTPVPDGRGVGRGVVAEGPVGLQLAGHVRWFRYEVRRWPDGVVPDLAYAVSSPVVITRRLAPAEAIFDLLPSVPKLTWGRDELRAGEMWTCNSITSWVLTKAGIDVASIPFPPRSRAPGWDAGITVARREAARQPGELVTSGPTR